MVKSKIFLKLQEILQAYVIKSREQSYNDAIINLLILIIFLNLHINSMNKATLKCLSRHLNAHSKILLRADFNVPIKQGKVQDLKRIKSTIPTLHQILKYQPKSLVLLSHLGRPGGKREEKYSLRPIVEPLQSLLGRKVTFLQNCIGENIRNQINNSQGEVFLCQNVRFHPEEKGSIINNVGQKVKINPLAVQQFRNQLSQLGQVFVNDAFGCSHRKHSSVVGVKHKHKVAGLLMQKQLKTLGNFLHNPKKPILIILGGAKVTDKIGRILDLLNIADQIIIGGGMCNPFLKEFGGFKLGSTDIHYPADPKGLQKIIDKAKQRGVKIHFPIDGVCSQTFSPSAPTITYDLKDIPAGWKIFDNGPKSIEQFRKVVDRANSIFWNGPIGVFEFPNFRNGSQSLLKYVINQTKKGALSIIGGGDTANLVHSIGAINDVSYISTGGGASIQYLGGVKLPGVEALSESHQLH